MDPIEARQLLTFAQAMQHASLSERTLYRGIKRLSVPIYTDAGDRRRRWIERADAERIAASIKPRRTQQRKAMAA